MATGTVERLVGKAIRRREDPRFLTGRGTFTDDIKLPGTQHAVFVRSSLAHARIRKIDASRALAQPGVRAVFTGKDLADGGVNPIPVGWLLPGLKTTDFRAIAVDLVRHSGEAVAVVVAESAAIARDVAELVEVEYEELPVVVDAVAALKPGAPQVNATAPDNRCFHWEIGDRARTEVALHGAAEVVRTRLVNQRLIANAIEPRASLASYQAATDELTLWVTSQNPHVHRLIMGAFVLGIPEQKFRVISPDVGGGFGSKIFIYPEEVAVAWLARRLGVPVKWTAQRSESFLTDAQGRDHVSDVEMGFDAQREARRAPGEDGGQPRCLPDPLRPGGSHLPLRDAAQWRLRHPRHLLRGGRRLHPYRSGGRLPRRGSARGLLPDRAHHGPRRP